jgi:CRP/FNR family cyclic AMP-dependent transcriptional regulator
MTQGRTKLWYLKNIDAFSNLSDGQVRMVDQYSIMREIKKGETLYLEGSSDKNIYILKKGVVKITRLTFQGREITLDIFKEGSIFGEMVFIESEERNESAEVIEDGLICIMRREDFDTLIKRMPNLSMQITKMIGLRRCKIENKLLDLLFSTVEQRVAKTLLNLLDDFGTPYNGGHLIKIKLTHRDYAALIASTRETVTATFNKLRDEGLIDFEGKYVVIKSLEGIKAIAG